MNKPNLTVNIPLVAFTYLPIEVPGDFDLKTLTSESYPDFNWKEETYRALSNLIRTSELKVHGLCRVDEEYMNSMDEDGTPLWQPYFNEQIYLEKKK
jgi:hypothetical protein